MRELPVFTGAAIGVEFRPALTVYRNKLLSRANKGHPVHAASLLRRRKIILEEELLRNPRELNRILIHEVFHFVWWKLGNARRRDWENVLARESRFGARGELGWSAMVEKQRLGRRQASGRTRRWRAYACESFCDTAAWYFVRGRHSEYTLQAPFRRRRETWLKNLLAAGALRL